MGGIIGLTMKVGTSTPPALIISFLWPSLARF